VGVDHRAKEKERGRIWQTMSGHDPASLVVPPLQRKERRPERSEEDRRRVEREKERKRER
jgi:hypothetical protein